MRESENTVTYEVRRRKAVIKKDVIDTKIVNKNFIQVFLYYLMENPKELFDQFDTCCGKVTEDEKFNDAIGVNNYYIFLVSMSNFNQMTEI